MVPPSGQTFGPRSCAVHIRSPRYRSLSPPSAHANAMGGCASVLGSPENRELAQTTRRIDAELNESNKKVAGRALTLAAAERHCLTLCLLQHDSLRQHSNYFFWAPASRERAPSSSR
jgi:hypothetical protein